MVYTTYMSVELAHHEIFSAKVGKGGINIAILYSKPVMCFTEYSYPCLAIQDYRPLP